MNSFSFECMAQIFYLCVCVSVCACFKDNTQKLTVQRGMCTSIHETALEQGGLRQFHMQKITSVFLQHALYSDKILTMDFQIQSYSALSSAPFWKAATWNNPEIANLPANPSTVLSPIPRLQMNSLSYLGFGEKFHSVHVTHSSSCWDNEKDKPTLGCQETTTTKYAKNRNY